MNVVIVKKILDFTYRMDEAIKSKGHNNKRKCGKIRKSYLEEKFNITKKEVELSLSFMYILFFLLVSFV